MEVTDRISLSVEKTDATQDAIEAFKDYICSETLAQMELVDNMGHNGYDEVELIDDISVKLILKKSDT